MKPNLNTPNTIKNEFYSKINLSKPLSPLIGKSLERLLSIDTLDYWYQKSFETEGITFSEKNSKRS